MHNYSDKQALVVISEKKWEIRYMQISTWHHKESKNNMHVHVHEYMECEYLPTCDKKVVINKESIIGEKKIWIKIGCMLLLTRHHKESD